jgi:hypothetical protein
MSVLDDREQRVWAERLSMDDVLDRALHELPAGTHLQVMRPGDRLDPGQEIEPGPITRSGKSFRALFEEMQVRLHHEVKDRRLREQHVADVTSSIHSVLIRLVEHVHSSSIIGRLFRRRVLFEVLDARSHRFVVNFAKGTLEKDICKEEWDIKVEIPYIILKDLFLHHRVYWQDAALSYRIHFIVPSPRNIYWAYQLSIILEYAAHGDKESWRWMLRYGAQLIHSKKALAIFTCVLKDLRGAWPCLIVTIGLF